MKENFTELSFAKDRVSEPKDTYEVISGQLQTADRHKRPESAKHSSNAGLVPVEKVHVELIAFLSKHAFEVEFQY